MEEVSGLSDVGIKMPLSARNDFPFSDAAAEIICGGVYRFDLGQGDVLDIESRKQWKEPSSWKDALLLLAISEGRYRAVKWLLREGANPNLRNMFGLPVLMTAIARKQAEVVRLLLDAGADTQVQHGGFTPLIYAQMAQDEAIIQMIEKH